MSFFGGQPEQGPSALSLAKIEAEMFADLFNKMSITCFKKCVVRHVSPDMTVGEMSCVDRCVGKYLQAQEKVEAVLKVVGPGMQVGK